MRSTWRVVFLRLLLLLEALLLTSRAHRRDRCTHLFWDSIFPFSVCKWRAPVFPGDSNLRHVPSLGILTPSTSCFALHPAGLVSSRPALLGFTRSPPSRSGLSTVSRHRASCALAPSTRPPSFRTPELRSGSLSRAFSPSMVARTSHPDSSPALHRATSGFPDDTLQALRSFTPRKDRDVLGLLRGARSLPS